MGQPKGSEVSKLTRYQRERRVAEARSQQRCRVADKIYTGLARTEAALLALADNHRRPSGKLPDNDVRVFLDNRQLGLIADAARLLRRVRDER